jgi:2,4-dienoyl-CoA reductase-like NADH-dependent reductase (Old Yellow Enzyme family)
MSLLFEPFELCGMELRNRFVRSATMENMSLKDGRPDPLLFEMYGELAEGGVGMINTSATFPDAGWSPGPPMKPLIIENDDAIPDFRRLTDAVHSRGARITVQLAPPFCLNGERIAPSPYSPGEPEDAMPREVTLDEMEGIIATYGAAARRAKEAGFDAVQIHGAHGYTLAKFLSPLFNKRADEYGGSVENRARFIVEILKSMKDCAGEDYPVFIKMNGADFQEGGMDIQDSAPVAEVLDREGIDAIEPSGGSVGGAYNSRGAVNRSQWAENFYMSFAEEIKSRVKAPVMMVGGLRRFEVVEAVIEEGRADLISMSRPFLREPDLVKRWMSGDRTPSECLACNGCSGLFMKGEPVGCVHRKK